MKKLIYTLLLCSIAGYFSSCVTSSMTPVQVYNNLLKYTESKLLTAEQAENLNCKCLVKKRSYVAPVGMSAKDDLINGAEGIDDWVKLDGGNTYVLTNYKWIAVGRYGETTQLHIEFDTYLCK